MATARPFPAIKPASRSYSPGIYPSTDFEALNGAKTHIRFGNKPVNATLNLSFSNIDDDLAALILGNYYEVNSVWDYVTFDASYAAHGIEDTNATAKTLTRQITEQEAIYGGKWRYSAPPKIMSSGKGVSNVSCSFVACLDSP